MKPAAVNDGLAEMNFVDRDFKKQIFSLENLEDAHAVLFRRLVRKIGNAVACGFATEA